MAAFEPYVGARYIYAKLTQYAPLAALVGTRVYRDVAPANAATPYIVFTPVAANDLMEVGQTRIWTNVLWQIEYWSKTSDDGVIAAGAALIDVALHRTSGTMTGSTYGSGTVWTMTRERALVLPAEIDGDVIYRRGGGEYRQYVTAA